MRMSKRKTALFLSAVMAVSILLTGCSQRGPAAEEPVETPAPTPTVAPVPTPTPTPEPTPEPTPTPRAELSYEAEDLTGSMTVYIEGETKTRLAKLNDSNYYTKLELPAGTEIEIQAESKISALYVIWDTVPGEWSVSADAFTVACGEKGFIHEYVELPEGTESLTLQLPEGGLLCDVYAFTDGRLPDYVQIWQDSVERADILLFPTHGDDELVFFGSVMPCYAGELGLSVQVVYLTNHWDKQPRPHEQLNGLWTVGVTAYPVFGIFNDYYTMKRWEAAYWYGEENVIAFQVEMIRRFQPQVIVEHAENGEYGHGVHMLNSYCMKTAVEYAADESYDGGSLEAYGVWDTPKLYLHMYQENKISLDYDQPLERFDGRTAYEMAQEGFAKHVSQRGTGFIVYPKSYGYDCSSFGLYRSTVGEDVEKNDLMENLTPYAEQ